MINRHLVHLWRYMKIHRKLTQFLFTLDRLPLLLLLRKNQFSSSPKTSQQSVRKPYCPLLVFNSPWGHLLRQMKIHRIHNSCLFTLERLPLLLLLRKNQFSSSPKTSQQSERKPYCPLLVFNSPCVQGYVQGYSQK